MDYTICHGWSIILHDDRPTDGPAQILCFGTTKSTTITQSPTTSKSTSKEYTNSALNFSVSFPASWQVADETSAESIFIKVRNAALGVDSHNPTLLGYAASTNYKTPGRGAFWGDYTAGIFGGFSTTTNFINIDTFCKKLPSCQVKQNTYGVRYAFIPDHNEWD